MAQSDRENWDLEQPTRNPDAISGAPGSHPVGTGLGALGAGAAGAAIGAAAGPAGSVVGAAIGTVVGAVAGGLAGREIAEAVNPTEEDTFWAQNYHTRPYYTPGRHYDEFRPMYQYGWESQMRHRDRPFEDVEDQLQVDWKEHHPGVDWNSVSPVIRDSYERVRTRRMQSAMAAEEAGRRKADLRP